MKPVNVNAIATIIRGSCKGFKGKVIAFDSVEDEVTIGIDVYTNVIVDSESIWQ
jgi:ribosomal protein L24